ncbi:hypothetical protein CKAH01_01919 [Colletotrichum kahawae]|uniref:Uncharacterized protein n=1 Tax=Colletotrichum kahawae TaxID=34407 RepID=A0AAE0D136_COLKA|nr:hypothetical protein CKAH01_01919 [Colletotrichum kahawae]
MLVHLAERREYRDHQAPGRLNPWLFYAVRSPSVAGTRLLHLSFTAQYPVHAHITNANTKVLFSVPYVRMRTTPPSEHTTNWDDLPKQRRGLDLLELHAEDNHYSSNNTRIVDRRKSGGGRSSSQQQQNTLGCMAAATQQQIILQYLSYKAEDAKTKTP